MSGWTNNYYSHSVETFKLLLLTNKLSKQIISLNQIHLVKRKVLVSYDDSCVLKGKNASLATLCSKPQLWRTLKIFRMSGDFLISSDEVGVLRKSLE